MASEISRVLTICAHPGDVLLGCGGTLARHVERGHEVRVLVLGDGWTSRVGSLEKGRDVIDLSELERQERDGLALLGVEAVEHLRLPDNRLDVYPLLDLAKQVERVKAGYRPHTVYTNSLHDLSVDQRRTCQAVLTAFRPQPGDNDMLLASFESPSSTEWGIDAPGVGFSPNLFVDVSTVLERKLQAVAALASELRSWPHPRSPEALRTLAKRRGNASGLEAAEAFRILRRVRPMGDQADPAREGVCAFW